MPAAGAAPAPAPADSNAADADERVRREAARRRALPARVAGFLAEHDLPTPCLVLDLAVVADRYHQLVDAMPEAAVHYAVKANAEPAVIERLAALGASFDVASPSEVDRCLDAGVAADRLSYGNPIKKERDIRHAFDRGVRRFVFDAEAELDKLAVAAPGADVLCRVATSGTGADWPLSGKFGCEPAMAADLLLLADRRGLSPVGTAFHVGSQQRDPAQWDVAIAAAADVFATCEAAGVPLGLLDLGGGFPGHYVDPVPDISRYVAAIRASVQRWFAGRPPSLLVEPGRFIVADAGVLHTEVILVARKAYGDDHRWVYVDAGVFGGLAETLGEAITYPIVTSRDAADHTTRADDHDCDHDRDDHDGDRGPVVLAGPTCDSLDVLYERTRYRLPLTLRAGDTVSFLSAGAYTSAYCTDGFNGFGPLAVYCIP